MPRIKSKTDQETYTQIDKEKLHLGLPIPHLLPAAVTKKGQWGTCSLGFKKCSQRPNQLVHN